MRKALHALADSINGSYRLRSVLSAAIQISVIWAILMLIYYVGFEVIAALTF